MYMQKVCSAGPPRWMLENGENGENGEDGENWENGEEGVMKLERHLQIIF